MEHLTSLDNVHYESDIVSYHRSQQDTLGQPLSLQLEVNQYFGIM